MAILYLTNSFPEAVESYVWEEIVELHSHGATVISCRFAARHIHPVRVRTSRARPDTYFHWSHGSA